MTTNYINQLQRDAGGWGNINTYGSSVFPDLTKSNTPIAEDVSMEERARKYAKDMNCDDDTTEVYFIEGWQQREQQLIPIIKELTGALKEIDEVNNGIGVINTDWLKEFTKTTLEKYKKYL